MALTGWRLGAAVQLGTWLIRALAMTWRPNREARAAFNAARRRAEGAPSGIVLAFWHGEILPVLVVHAADPAHAMISQSADGEVIARIASAFGARPIRGSSSKGGAEALIHAVQAARRGEVVVLTPDGPRGPRHSVAPGVVKAAQKSGVPLIALRVHADRAWVFKSWDRFIVPKPFARLRYAYSAPIDVSGMTLDEGVAAVAEAMAGAGRAAGTAD